MRGLARQLATSLRLYFRNTMALAYGYLFPTIFLVAFWVIYRYDRVPLVRHIGEVLTVTVLGGACFGLPTTIVGDRERGVWRRYRLAPISTGALVASTVAARYVLLITAGLLQLALALGIGMPLPRHPFDLWVAFTFVSFAFLGLGLVIATLADNVPAVQALGQSIFLPMLIIGGVAVPLAALPDWAQHVSAFFPGRYAVEAFQACVTGDGLAGARFDLLALTLIGGAGCLAGARLFRWDAREHFAARRDKGWVGVALVGWLAVGLLAEWGGQITILATSTGSQVAEAMPARPTPAPAPASPPPGNESSTAPARAELPTAGSIAPAPVAEPPAAGPARSSARGRQSSGTTRTPPAAPAARPGTPETAAGASSPATPHAGRGPAAPEPQATTAPASSASSRPAAAAPAAAAPAASSAETRPPASVSESAAGNAGAATSTPQPASPPGTTAPAAWQAVTMRNIDQDLVFDHLPSDAGVVTPVAPVGQEPDPELTDALTTLRNALPTWGPALVADPVQRARNLLYVPAVIDVWQLQLEPYVPLIAFAQLQRSIPHDDLVKILYWIAVHPDQGDASAVRALPRLGLADRGVDINEVRGRVGVYAVKLLGRLTGKRPGR